jgi:hypothetical protein
MVSLDPLKKTYPNTAWKNMPRFVFFTITKEFIGTM